MRRGVPACAIGFGKPIGSIVQILLETMNPGGSLSPAPYNLPPSPTTPPPTHPLVELGYLWVRQIAMCLDSPLVVYTYRILEPFLQNPILPITP